MRFATGVSAADSASGEIRNKKFLRPLGLTANAPRECDKGADGGGALARNDCSPARRLDGGAG